MKAEDKFEMVSKLGRSRGFFWPSCEIYGGISGFMNWGSLGTISKRKIEEKFRDIFLRRLGFYEIESPIITAEKVFKASGHIDHFKEPMIECTKCRKNFRADHLLQELGKLSSQETDKMTLGDVNEKIKEHRIMCPECGGDLGEPKYFLTMFRTTIGPYSDSIGYGRPEAAQGVFVEFKRLYEQAREKLPVGFAQIGHALRNEISPRQGPIRLREFTIIDMEFFFDPERPECPLINEIANNKIGLVTAENRLKGSEKPIDLTVAEILEKGYIKMEWQAFFMGLAKSFLSSLGIPDGKQRFVEKQSWERAHYSIQGFDQEVYLDRWGWTEVAGFNDRADYDLKSHMKESGVDMTVFKTDGKRTVSKILLRPVPARIGPTFRDESAQVIRMISGANPKEVEDSFAKEGFYMAGKFKIAPEHVDIMREETEERGRHFVPHVIEPSFGSDRLTYAALEYAYTIKNDRVVLRLPRDIVPTQIAVLPLVSKDGLPEQATKLHKALLDGGFTVDLDESGSIGRRYARFDEIGTPLCVAVDYQTLEDETVTLRDRDSWDQVRAKIRDLPKLFNDYFGFKLNFKDLGSPFKIG